MHEQHRHPQNCEEKNSGFRAESNFSGRSKKCTMPSVWSMAAQICRSDTMLQMCASASAAPDSSADFKADSAMCASERVRQLLVNIVLRLEEPLRSG